MKKVILAFSLVCIHAQAAAPKAGTGIPDSAKFSRMRDEETAELEIAREAAQKSEFVADWQRINSDCGLQPWVVSKVGYSSGSGGATSTYSASRLAKCNASESRGVVLELAIFSRTGEMKNAETVRWKVLGEY